MRERASLAALEHAIVRCRACPRLVAWRERVAREKRAAFRESTYWGRPVPGFGDPRARLLVLGLAPAAHGANRTGRVFTGDESGRFLFAALHRAGLANQPESLGPGDGLRLRDCWIAAAVRCAPPANRPTRAEAERCRPFLLAEIERLGRLRAILCLGAFAWEAAFAAAVQAGGLAPRPRPAFGHGARARWRSASRELALVASYHPSQQNTFTGRLTPAMLDAAVGLAVAEAGRR